MIVNVNDHGHEYKALAFVCPGCERTPLFGGLHQLPVEGDANGKPVWNWDGNLEAPTLNPSILTKMGPYVDGKSTGICHSFLRNGVFEFLADCTHQFKGQHIPMPELYEWFVKDHMESTDAD